MIKYGLMLLPLPKERHDPEDASVSSSRVLVLPSMVACRL